MTVLAGLNVLELGSGSMTGSMTGMILADNGARVLKLEPPDGDRMRRESRSGFLVWNRGKESVVADLHQAAGRAVALELASKADVVIEAFGTGVAERFGVDYEHIRAVNPSVVYCSIKGFGSTGRYASLKGYEGVVAAKTGVFTRGMYGPRPGPIFTSAPMASTGATQMSVGGILAALTVRDRCGLGQFIETTLAQGINPIDYFGQALYQHQVGLIHSPTSASTQTTEAPKASRYQVTCCTKDGRWIIAVPQMAHQAQALVRAVGLAHTLEDPRFAKCAVFDSLEDAQAWEDMLMEAFRTKTLDEWLPILIAEPDLPFEAAVTGEEALDNPQIVHNGNVIVVDDPDLGPVREVGPLVTFSRTAAVIARSAPRLDEHAGPLVRQPVVSRDEPTPQYPLAGMTIVEWTCFYACPYGVAMAAAMGARVIKIEDLTGDPMRQAFGPWDIGAAKTMEGKESVAVDLRTEEGRAIVRALAATADAFVTNFRPGVPERYELDYESLSRLNPGLLYLHATGYGVDGPFAKRPNYASAASAAVGSYYAHVGYWMDPALTEGFGVMEINAILTPRLRVVVDGDANPAAGVFSALLLGLFERTRSGKGQFMSTSMIGSNAYCYSEDFTSYAGKAPTPIADAEQYGLNALYRSYEASQGWVFVAAATDKEWTALLAEIGAAELSEDPRFATPAARRANDDALASVLQASFAKRTASEWEELLTTAGVGCAEWFQSAGPESMLGHGVSEFSNTDPVMKETGLVVEVDHPTFGRMNRYGLPAKLALTPGRIASGCLLGQHTETVLTEMGYSQDRIADLDARKVVALGA